jgi:hypothetical protein
MSRKPINQYMTFIWVRWRSWILALSVNNSEENELAFCYCIPYIYFLLTDLWDSPVICILQNNQLKEESHFQRNKVKELYVLKQTTRDNPDILGPQDMQLMRRYPPVELLLQFSFVHPHQMGQHSSSPAESHSFSVSEQLLKVNPNGNKTWLTLHSSCFSSHPSRSQVTSKAMINPD